MTTFTINFTDFMNHFWTMDWTPTTLETNSLSETDIQAVVRYIKDGKWTSNASAAAKHCYDTLATKIANIIVEESITTDTYSALVSKINRCYTQKQLSPKGATLYKRIRETTHYGIFSENTPHTRKILKKIIKTEPFFAVKFAEDENWSVDVQKEMRCCICGERIEQDCLGHNPYPVRPESWYGEKEYRCCSLCNMLIVLPTRIRYGRNFPSGHNVLMDMDYEELLEMVA